MHNQILHVVTTISNPLRWESRMRLARAAILSWIQEPNVHVTLVEVAHGSRNHDLLDLAGHHQITHIPVRATTMAWCKESCLNIGISRLPQSAKYIGVFDADITFRKPGWALETIHALQIYPVVQPWKTAYDLGPEDDHFQTHKSFASQFHYGKPIIPRGFPWWVFNGGPYDYPHSGFAWAWVRDILDIIGGLFELGGMGSGDHNMALSLLGHSDYSLARGIGPEYRSAVKTWEARALTHVNRKIGFVPNTIEHGFHGTKTKRNYVGRWDMFIKHHFDPYRDLKKNTYGVIEFAGNKPQLELDFNNYLRDRHEDSNIIEE